MRVLAVLTALLALADCSPKPPQSELHVAAATNLSHVLATLAARFEREEHIHVVPSYGATAQLAQQIENGAPWDVFLSADVTHVNELIDRGFAIPSSRTVYARGRLAVWAPRHPELRSLDQLAAPDIAVIVLAKPELAPYGQAAVDTLRNAGLWDKVEKKIVYAPSISAAKQFADTGNGDAAFTALALTTGEKGHFFAVDEKLHQPIDQAICAIKTSQQPAAAQAFVEYVLSPQGRAILENFGYGLPPLKQ